MIRRLLSSQSKTITGAAIILGSASFISRIIGFLRDRLFAHYFVKRAMIDGLGDGFNPLNKRSVNPPKYDGKVAIEEAFNYAYPIVKVKQTSVLNDKFFNDLLLGYQIN